MDTIRDYLAFMTRLFANIKIKYYIKKNGWQEIAKSLKTAHGVHLKIVYPFAYLMEMAHKTGAFSMTKDVRGTSMACDTTWGTIYLEVTIFSEY